MDTIIIFSYEYRPRELPVKSLHEMPSMDSVRAVERAIDVLQAFVGQPQGLKIAEIERITKIARPTLYRLVRTLAKRNLVRFSSDPTRYELDIGVIELAQTWLRSVDPVPRSESALQVLARKVGETVALSIKRGDKRIYVREIPSRHMLTFSRGVGVVESLLRGAGGLAILTFVSEHEIDRLLKPLPLAERGRVRANINATRERGFAVSESSIIDGAIAVAVPIYDASGNVAGSVGVYGPAARINKAGVAKIGNLLLACAQKISMLAV